MPTDPEVREHQAWIGYLQPEGLVVSAAALVDAQVLLNRDALPLQQRFLTFVEEVPLDGDPLAAIPDFPAFRPGVPRVAGRLPLRPGSGPASSGVPHRPAPRVQRVARAVLCPS